MTNGVVLILKVLGPFDEKLSMNETFNVRQRKSKIWDPSQSQASGPQNHTVNSINLPLQNKQRARSNEYIVSDRLHIPSSGQTSTVTTQDSGENAAHPYLDLDGTLELRVNKHDQLSDKKLKNLKPSNSAVCEHRVQVCDKFFYMYIYFFSLFIYFLTI